MSGQTDTDLSAGTSALPWSRSYRELVTRYEGDQGALVFRMNARPRACFTPQLLQDIKNFQNGVRASVEQALAAGSESPVRFLILASEIDGVFNYGGDLEFFVRTIRAGDRQTLTDYAHLSIDVLYQNLVNLGMPLTTIALLEGVTLGAGFESALSCDLIIAERDVQIAFPEVVFNMFPGMGAYSFLGRRLCPAEAERMILGGKRYTAEELHEKGIIDILADPGSAKHELGVFLRTEHKTRLTRNAVLRMRERMHPISYSELLDNAQLWVESALSLGDRDLRMMERLMRMQNRAVGRVATRKLA